MTRPDVITGPGQLPRAHLRWIIFRSVCGSVFAVGRRRLRPAVARPRVARCTRADVA